MKAILFFSCIVSACTSIKTVFVPYYSDSISFYENTVAYYTGNRLMKCKLNDTAYLNGYKCISWIWFFENGQLKQLETATELKMKQYVIPKNSILFFNAQNWEKIQYVWFSKDTKVNDVACKGGGKISTEFYENDSLKSCFLAQDQYIQGFPCKSSVFRPVCFYPNGKIKIFTLSDDISLSIGDFKIGETVVVDEYGKARKFDR